MIVLYSNPFPILEIGRSSLDIILTQWCLMLGLGLFTFWFSSHICVFWLVYYWHISIWISLLLEKNSPIILHFFGELCERKVISIAKIVCYMEKFGILGFESNPDSNSLEA